MQRCDVDRQFPMDMGRLPDHYAKILIQNERFEQMNEVYLKYYCFYLLKHGHGRFIGL